MNFENRPEHSRQITNQNLSIRGMSSPLSAATFAIIIARVSAGEAVRPICADLSLNRNDWYASLRSDARCQAEYDQAWAFAAERAKPRERVPFVFKPAPRIDEVLALIATGMSVKAVCGTDLRFPTTAQFNCRLQTDAALRARFDAVCPRAGRGRPNLEAHEHADESLGLIESGMSVRKACASDSRFSARESFVAALRHVPAFKLRYDLALARRERPVDAPQRPRARDAKARDLLVEALAGAAKTRCECEVDYTAATCAPCGLSAPPRTEPQTLPPAGRSAWARPRH